MMADLRLNENPEQGVMPESSPLSILDFGIGDGEELKQLELRLGSLVGIDISAHMVQLALEAFVDSDFRGIVGGVEALTGVEGDSIDLAFCVNTLGYLSHSDRQLFFEEMRRIIKPGGYLIVVTGNELFDLFALNSGTAEFFERNFGVAGVSELLTEGASLRFKNASRENPLNFSSVLNNCGFLEVGQAFSQWHRQPPIQLSRSGFDLRGARGMPRDHDWDPNSLPPEISWRALFQCSIFGSLSRRG